MTSSRGSGKSFTRVLLGFLLTSLVLGCAVQTVKHDPVKAVADSSDFLKALYIDKNYPKALELADWQLRQSLTANDLSRLVEGIRNARGELKTLKADSYLMTPGKTMELFYVGTYEKGVLYHHLVLVGDLSTGYKVSGPWYSLEPYPEQLLRRNFDEEMPVE